MESIIYLQYVMFDYGRWVDSKWFLADIFRRWLPVASTAKQIHRGIAQRRYWMWVKRRGRVSGVGYQ